MAEVARLDTILTADTSGFTTAMKGATTSTEKFGAAAAKVDTSINKTKTNFTGLNRVIQDLPFGFIAIQNNIEQIFPAAGALGLAISVITAAITFAQVGTSAWTRGLIENKKAADDFTQTLKDAEQGALATTSKLQSFVTIARDVTKSTEERNFALKEANKLLGEHGEKLTLVNINTQATTDEVNKFTQALINEAVAAKYADRVADLIIRQKEASKAYGVVLQEFNKQKKEADTQAVGAGASPFFQAQVTQTDVLAHKYKEVIGAANAYKEITKDLNQVTGDLNSTQEKSIADFSALGTKIKDVSDKTKALKPKEVTDKLTPAIRRLKFDNDIIIEQSPQQLGSIITKSLDKKGGVVVAPKLIVRPHTVDIQALNADLNQALAAIAVNIAEGFGQAIGEAFAGKNPFNNLGRIIGEGIKELGGLLIKYGVLAELANKAISLGPIGGALAIAAGIGLEALGAYIEAKSIKTHAEGGIFTQPTQWGNHIIGEKGPEALVPLNRMGELGLAGGRQVVVMDTRISGNDLILIQNRAQTAANRAYGSNFNRRN